MAWVFVFAVAAGPLVVVADVGPCLRFTGRAFAPKLRGRDGVPMQHSLQYAFLDMWETVVRAVSDFEGVLMLEVRGLTLC